MTFRGYGGGGPPSASSSYFGSQGPGDDRKSVASNVGAGGFRPSGYSDAREHDLVRGSGQENRNQSSYSSFKRSEDMLRVTVGNSLYVPPGSSGGSTEVDNGASSWGRGGGSAQFERTVESLGSQPGMHNDGGNNQWNVPQPDFRQRNRAPVVSEGNMHMADSGVDDKWSGRAEPAAGRSGDLTRRAGPMPPAHSRSSEREVGASASHAARNDTNVSGGFTAGRTSDFGGQRDSIPAAWRSADTGLYAQQSVAADHLGTGAGMSAPKSILKSKPFGQPAMPAIAERMIPSAIGSDGLNQHHHHVGSAVPDGSSARAALQAQSLLVAAAAAAASSAGSSSSSSSSSSIPARAQVFDYGHSKPDVLFGNKANVPQSDLQGGPSSTGPTSNVGVTDGTVLTAAGRDLMQDPLFDSIIKSMGVDFDPKKKLQERARELEQQVEEAARRKRREKTEEEMARQFGINKTASFLEGGDLDIGAVLGSSAALVTSAVRRSADNDAREAASHHRRNGAGAQSSVPEPCAANAASIRDSHPDQESGKSRRGGASPSRKSHVESDAGGGAAHVREGRSSSDSGRSGGVGDRYDARHAGSSQRATGAGYSSERSFSGAQSSHYVTRSSAAAARDVTTEFASSLSPEEQHDRRSVRDMTDRRPLSDSRQTSEATSQRTKGDRSTRSDAIDMNAQYHRRGSDVGSDGGSGGGSGSSARVPTPGGGEAPSSTGVLTREEHEKLKLEMEDRRRRLRLLEGELEKLRWQQNELMRKNQQQRGGGVGRRDPFIDENTRLQEDISKQIAQLRKTAEANERALAARLALPENASNTGGAGSTKSTIGGSDTSGATQHGRSSESWGSSTSASSRDGRDSRASDDVIERLSSHFSHDQAKALSAALGDSSAATTLFRTLLQFHPSLGGTATPMLQHKQLQSFEDRSASKSSSTSSSSAGVDGGIGRQPLRSAAPRPSPPTEGAVYEYYDSSAHWCKPCNVELPTLSGLLEHLAADSHQQALEQPERPWVASALQQRAPVVPSKTAKKENATTIKLPLKGSEFIVPAPQAFYCRLCSSFAGDQRCMEAHIKSGEHYESYKKYTSDNPFYERRYTLDREASARLRKRRQEEDARLADRAKRQRLDDELVNKKLEALKTRHRQTLGDVASSTTAMPDGAAIACVPEAAAKESATTRSLTPESADDGCGGGTTQRLDLQGGIKKEPSCVAKSSLADAAEASSPSRDGASTSKKMRLGDVGSNAATALPSAKEQQSVSTSASSAGPPTERCEAGSVLAAATVDVGRPISVVVGKKAFSSTAATQSAATHVASAAAAMLAGATVGVANAPLTVASGTGRQQRSSQQARSTQYSAAVTVDRTSAASASAKPATGPAQPGGLSVGGMPPRPASRATAQTSKAQATKAAGALISPSSKRAAATPTAATSAAAAVTAETGSKSSSASGGAAAASGSRQGAAAAVPAIPTAKTVGKTNSVQETRSPVAGSVRPAASAPSQPDSSAGTSPVPTATGAALSKPPGPSAGFSQSQSGDKAIAASGVCSAPASKPLPASAAKQAAPATTTGAVGQQQQQSRPSQQHQTRSAASAAAGPSASVAGGGKLAGGVEATSGIGSNLAAAAKPSTTSAAATSLTVAPPAAQQSPAAKPDSLTCRVPEPDASPAISQTAKVTVPGSIAVSQSEVDSKPGMPADESPSVIAATAERGPLSRATASSMHTADRTGLSKAPSQPSPSPASGGESGTAAAAGAAALGRQETAAKVSRPAASTVATTTTATPPAAAKPAAATAASASAKRPAAGGQGSAAPVSSANVAVTTGGASNRPGATAVAAVAPADRTRAQRPTAAARPATAASSSSASAGKSVSQLPSAERPAANVPMRASGGTGQSTRLSSSPATRQAAGKASHAAVRTGGAQAVSSATVAVKPASAASIDDVAAAKVAVVKPAGAAVSSATTADASDLEGDGSVSGADEGSADDLSMDGDFEILDEYEEHEEHA